MMLRDALRAGEERYQRPGRETLDAFARKIAELNRAQRGRTFLWMGKEAWARLAVTWIVGGLLVAGGWWLAARDTLRAAVNEDQVEALIEKHQAAETHPETDKELDAIRVEQRVIRESQIRQEEAAKATAAALQDIKADLRRRRRR